jgi:glycosyltransferase involved in cell wall biosynthesis
MHKIGLLFYGALKAPTGASTVLRNIALGFDTVNEFDLKIYALDANGTFIKSENKLSSKFRLKEYLKKTGHKVLKKGSKYSLLLTKIYVWMQYHRNVKFVIRKYKHKILDVDILFFHDILTPYHLKKNDKELWNRKKKTIVLHSNGEVFKMLFSYFPKLKENKKTSFYYENQIAISVLSDVDKIILLSDFAKDNFLKVYPQFGHKVSVVPNGIKSENEQISTIRKIFTITTVGTVCERKGHDLLIEALSLMTQTQRKKFIVNIIGDGGIVKDLKNRCLKENIENIFFLGTKKNVKKYLLESDCFLLASRDEGLPMAIIEAMSLGLPIISTSVGGVPDLVKDNYNGILIKPNNSVLLKEAIIKMVNETSIEKIRLGQNSKVLFTQKYTQEKMIDGYKSIFDNLI